MRSTRGGCLAALAALAVLATPAAASAAAPLAPLDAQNWSWQDNLTWNDYHAIPGPDYSDPSVQPSVKKWKVAIVLTDFPDKTFTLSQPVGSTVFGTPTAEAHDIPRADVPAFLRDFLNKPQALNHFQTMNRYWMEDTYGKYGVQLDAYGPYQLPSRSYQYFQQDFDSSNQHCPTPTVTPCNKNYRTDAKAAWTAATSAATVASYDNIFYVSAGEDESSTWQEFGEMKWMTQDQVPDAFGPKAFDPTLPNWAPTRYVPWTSWASATTIWPNASGNTSIEAESSGMATFSHELTHNLGIGDNYSNPYGTVQQRGFTGMWDMMSRGSFNGPGGPHTRYLIPATQGGSLGSQHDIRNKLKLGFVTPAQVLRLNRSGITSSGLVVADVKARESDPGSELAGVQIALDGTGDNEPPCVVASNWLCDGVVKAANGTISGKYNFYTAEVVQQIGSDSFDPGHGVILAKTKTAENNSCGTAACFVWIIDSHPNDINHVDFIRPDGTPKLATLGDERQLNDASFNAGTNSGSSYEYEDTPNRLHFYIVNKRTDAQGVLHYTIGIKSLDGAGPQTRGVALQAAPATAADPAGDWATCTFPLTNTGASAPTDPAANPSDATPYLQSDVYNLSASTTGTGWTAQLKNALATAKFGETISVPVYVSRAAGAASAGSVALTATSVSDPTKTATAVCGVSDGQVGGSVPSTLSLTLGTPAAFGAFTPGLTKDYAASMTANVISTAGDGVLSVADPSATATGHLVNGAFSLPSALQAQASSAAGVGSALANVGGSASPTSLLTYSGPTSNDAVTVAFQQHIGSTDALRTGSYAKTLTFTLSTTTP
jgi:M6 family metalloprotease-like protein